MALEYRRKNAYSFMARAEVVGESRTLRTTVTELSLYGCYLESDRLERGRDIVVKILTESEYFEAKAKVILSEQNVGSCLAFREIEPPALSVLKGWLKDRESQK